MKEIRLEEKDYSYVFSPYARPVATVSPGETVVLYAEDAAGGRLHSPEQDPTTISKYSNPQVGPLYIEGAEPGDTLKIKIVNIERARDWAVSCFKKYLGGLVSTPTTRMLHEPLPQMVFIYKYAEGMFRYNDRLKFPWEPFLGTIATAPEIEAISSFTPFSQGGNMDVPDVKVGNTIYLPVCISGAYFYTGDCHAKQGQGEVCGSALEISARVTLTFELIKNKVIKWPRIESPDELMCVGSAKPMEDAARIAYCELLEWLEELGWDRNEAYQAISQAGKLYVGNMVDTSYSLVAKIDKEIAYRK
jgi:amidase